jgi:hypothetical protein
MHFVRAKKHTQEDKTHFASQQSSFVSLEEASLQNTSSGEEKRFRGESSANNSPSTRCNLQRGINKDGFRWARLEVEKKHRPTCSSRASRQKQTGARAAATWAACASPSTVLNAEAFPGLPACPLFPRRLPSVGWSPLAGCLPPPETHSIRPPSRHATRLFPCSPLASTQASSSVLP